MIPESQALAGIEFPCRASVVNAEAGPSGYRATVEALDRTGELTGRVLSDLPLDPLWLAGGGQGVFAPPAPKQIVAVVWMGGDAGHPVITAAGMVEPAVPRLAVPVGEHSLQGETWDARMRPDEWRVRDEAGAELSGQDSRWRVAGPSDDLHAVLQQLLDDLIVSFDVVGNLFAAPTIAALTGIKSRVSAVLRS